MARIQISETQFAFAFFHKYLLLPRQKEVIFIFPTLRQEGNPDIELAGADLVVDGNLFFQFKMPEFLTTHGAVEIQNGQLDRNFVPFYRFQIKNSPKSCQFNLLQKAARRVGNIVRYISPMFHVDKNESDEEAFIRFFRSSPTKAIQLVCSINFSQFIEPDRKQPEDDTHKICYSLKSVSAGTGYIFSEPDRIQVVKGIDEFNGEFLSFSESPNTVVSLELAIREVIDLFDLRLVDSTAPQVAISSIEELQVQLIIHHNIFWLPIIRSTKERRKRVLDILKS